MINYKYMILNTTPGKNKIKPQQLFRQVTHQVATEMKTKYKNIKLNVKHKSLKTP